MRKTWSVGVFATLIAVIGAGTAMAGSTPRLQGKFRVRITITAAKNIGQHRGDTGVLKWSFAPKCSSGACTTRFTRRTLTKATVHELMKPAAGRYHDNLTTTLECVHGSTVLAKKGYTAKLTIVLKPGTTKNGSIKAFSGTGTVIDTPTGAGRAHHCAAAHEKFQFHSL